MKLTKFQWNQHSNFVLPLLMSTITLHVTNKYWYYEALAKSKPCE